MFKPHGDTATIVPELSGGKMVGTGSVPMNGRIISNFIYLKICEYITTFSEVQKWRYVGAITRL
jgi:hypothetical protein